MISHLQESKDYCMLKEFKKPHNPFFQIFLKVFLAGVGGSCLLHPKGKTKVLIFCHDINLKMSKTSVCIVTGILPLSSVDPTIQKVNLHRPKPDFVDGLEITLEQVPEGDTAPA